MVQAISTKYGTPTRPAGEISFPTNELYRLTEKVIARWEDPQYSINLVRSRFLNSYALFMFSKRPDAQVEAALPKSIKLKGQEHSHKKMHPQKTDPYHLQPPPQHN